MIEPHVDFIYPEEKQEEGDAYREASRKFLRIMNIYAAFLVESKSRDVTMWATSYALGLAICEGVSVSDRAAMLGITPQALSKKMDEFCRAAGLPSSAYGYKKQKSS